MSKTKAYISAARLRTLPLSVSGILTGTALALAFGAFSWGIFILALLTTIGLQVLANFANDYGDGIKGTDSTGRVGPLRALQSGLILPHEMKRAIIITIALTLVVAVFLLYTAFGTGNLRYILLFLLLGIVALIAAVTYTVGKSAYGYHGLGDLFVLLFFGWLSVVGSCFLYTLILDWLLFLPATTIGLLSVGVLNLNNMRDRESDALVGKNTLVVLIGPRKARQYHFFILISAFASALCYTLLAWKGYEALIPFLAFIPIFVHLRTVFKNKNPTTLDPELKKLALSTFLFSLLFLISALI